MQIAFSLRTLQRQRLKELKLFLRYTKKVEEKSASSTFLHVQQLNLYLGQLKQINR